MSEQEGRSGAALSSRAAVVARGSLVNVVAMVTGAAMSFGLVVLVSRWLQPRGAGAFFELLALFAILSNTFELGADTGLTRWISRAQALGGLRDVRRVVGIAVIPVAIVGGAAAVAMWVVASQIAQFFLRGLPVGAGVTDVRIVALLVPLGALSSCLVDGARGFGRMWPYLLIEGTGKPALRIALVVAVLAAGLGLRAAVIAWGLPVIIGLVAGAIIFVRLLRKEVPVQSALSRQGRATDAADAGGHAAGRRPPARQPGSHRGPWCLISRRSRRLAAEFWAFTGLRALQATFQVIILWLDILIVGALASNYAAGVYGAVSKLAIVGTFTLEGNRLAIGPQLSALLARRQYRRAAELFQTSTRWLMLASWPLYLLFAVFPAAVLNIFGPRYTAGASALAVLSLAMLVNLGTGNVTVVLLMGGRSSWSAINAGAALAVNIGLNLVLIPRMGILGAAIAWAASIVIDNATAMIEIWWFMDIDPFGAGYWSAAGITVACFGGPAVAVRTLLGQNLAALGVALAVGSVALVITLYFAREPFRLAGVFSALRPSTPAPRSASRQSAAWPSSVAVLGSGRAQVDE